MVNDINPDTTELAHRITGVVLLPGDPGYAEETATYNPAVPNTPALVVGAADASDVQAAVAFAHEHDLAVAVLNTGHTTVVAGERTLLITTGRMTGVTIDPAASRARVGAGVRWQQVVDEAARHGLAPLTGSSPLVGVVGYTLGGGLSATMGRKYGWASDHVTALDIVTADGKLRHADAGTEPELFWAVRGSKSNLGVVTAIEFGLFPVTRLHGGALIFPGEHAGAVLRAYAALTAQAPDELTTSIAFMRLPDLPVFPEPLRGTFTVHVRISFLGTAEAAEALLAPLRAAGPVIADTVSDRPYTDFAAIYSDPEGPAPFSERTLSLPPLTDDLVEELTGAFGPGADVPATIVELRHLGGALHGTPAGAGAAGLRTAEFVLWVVTVGFPEQTAPAGAWTDGLFGALRPWAVEGKHLNFIGQDDLGDGAVRAAYPPAIHDRLARAKAAYDPANLFHLNHNIRPAGYAAAPAVTPQDRAAIADTLHRYAAGLDLNDAGLLTSALTDDAVVDLGPAMRRIGYDFPPLGPREVVVATLIGAVGPLDSSHSITNIRATVDGDTATVHAYAQAQHFPPGAGSDPAVTRHALMMNRYTAAMVRDGEQWRIRHLDISNAWFEGDAAMLLGE